MEAKVKKKQVRMETLGKKNGNSDWEKMWDWECYENTYIAERTMVTASPLLVVTWDALRII